MNKLELNEVSDAYVQENMRRIKEYLDESVFQGASLIEVTLGKAETQLKVPHGLAFLPEDVILTNRQGAGSLTIHYDQTTREFLVLSSTDACVVRLIVGTLGGT